jgi:hypothetical protein
VFKLNNTLIFTVFTLLLHSGMVQAEDARWYQVEVILFSQDSEGFRGSEQWPNDYRLPDSQNAIELRPYSEGERVAFSLIASEGLQLNGEADRVRADPDLRLLTHMAWIQPGLESEKTKGVRLALRHEDELAQQAIVDPFTPPALEGVLTLTLSRYLHIKADLLYREARRDGEFEDSMEANYQPPGPVDLFMLSENNESLPWSPWQIYRMEESRRMRSNELHYLDHPMFGMLVRVTPL